ncbi:MAG: alpha/beta hydrolase [Bacilli bacterium]
MKINNIQINYLDYGNKCGIPLIFLHGWGQNIEMMKIIADKYTKENRIVIIDLPGHGQSEEPKYPWTLYDFVEMLNELIIKLKINNPILIGHSFGGKISLLYASKYNVKKLVLFGSPFKKEIKKLSIKTKILKKLKKITFLNKFENFAKKHIGSTDYKNASSIMRKILVNHINLDITSEVTKIACPTLLIWGTLDQEVSIKDAYELEMLIKDSAVISYEGCTHYAYLENLGQTINVLNSFIN